MRYGKAQITSRVHKIPELRFEDQGLTSVAGLVIIQSLFAKLKLKSRLRECFAHMPDNTAFGHYVIVLGFIVHLMLGYRRLRDMDYYRDDLMVLRLTGLKKLPDVSMVSRELATMDATGILKLCQLCRENEQVDRADEGGSTVERLQAEHSENVFNRGGQFSEIFRQVSGGVGQRGSEGVFTPSEE
jgi:hypothetical protein